MRIFYGKIDGERFLVKRENDVLVVNKLYIGLCGYLVNVVLRMRKVLIVIIIVFIL